MDDSWNVVPSGPSARAFHAAFWIGSEMLIWGGGTNFTFADTGGRYNPRTNAWIPISTANAPAARSAFAAVWTGAEMIVWGGWNSPGGVTTPLNTGARYNPASDTWTAMSTANAPAPRYGHKAVWTGSEMIVWGGTNGSNSLETGAKYNPQTDTWVPITTADAPTARLGFTAVWSGSAMIVWGGDSGLNTGGRYNPSSDTWTTMATSDAPAGRSAHTAIWTGSEMIVWGGYTSSLSTLNTGGRYNPATDSWTPMSTANAPSDRSRHSAVWTGSEMIVWGGSPNDGPFPFADGGRYNPSDNAWTAVNAAGAPSPRGHHTAVWTGGKMIVWGGLTGAGRNTVYYDDGGMYCVRTPLALLSAASAAAHGSSEFEINLPLSQTAGIECRSGDGTGAGKYTAAFTFSNPISSVDAASVSCGSVVGSNVEDSNYYLFFDGSACNQQYVTITLNGVHDVYSQGLPSTNVTLGILLGDVNGDATVNAADALLTRSRSGQPFAAGSYRADVNVNGSVNSGDALVVRNRSGQGLP